MEENVQKIFKEQYNKLPPELQQAIMASDLRVKLAAIMQKYRLHIDKASVLENEVVLVLMGMESPDEFVNNARRELAISPEDSRALARDVNDQIFHPIREKLESFINKQAQEFGSTLPPVTPGDALRPTAPPAPNLPVSNDRYREPVDDALPQAAVVPLPAVPKNIVADKLRGVSTTAAPVTAAPKVPTPAPTTDTPVTLPKVESQKEIAAPLSASSISFKSFGIQVGEEKKTESKLPISPSTAPKPATPDASAPPTTPKPSADPYRETV